MELSPGLLSRLEEASAADLSLRDEVALARTLLDEVLARVAAVHGQTGALDPALVGFMMDQLKQINQLVESAASIEAKRGDQVLSATHVLLLLTALRDDLKRSLGAVFGDDAGAIVDDAFRRQPWTGGLDPRDIAQALAAPAAYEVKFRPLEREGGDGPVRERREAIPAEKLLEELGRPTTDEKLRRELEAADGEDPGHNGNGHGGNGHAH